MPSAPYRETGSIFQISTMVLCMPSGDQSSLQCMGDDLLCGIRPIGVSTPADQIQTPMSHPPHDFVLSFEVPPFRILSRTTMMTILTTTLWLLLLQQGGQTHPVS
jgi:hypothetical protein